MLECHRLAITVFYPANRDNGTNQIELASIDQQCLHNKLPADVKQLLIFMKYQSGDIIDKEHLKNKFVSPTVEDK